MKYNEAPEKLYVDTEDRLSGSILYGFTEKRNDDDIEYIRKDTIIKKIEEWLRENQMGFILCDEDIEDFKKYIKGE